MVEPLRWPATFEDLVAHDDPDRLEIIGGKIVERAAGSLGHSIVMGELVVAIHPFSRRANPSGTGDWWNFSRIHVGYASGDVYCHDVASWRRDRVLTQPTEWPVRIRPDWVCEIVSPKHKRTDLVDKPRVLHQAEVPHYWILDPVERILLVHRWSPDGYVVVQRAAAGEVIRAEPFDAIELRVGALFGDEDA